MGRGPALRYFRRVLRPKEFGLWTLLLANLVLLIRHFFFGLPVESVILGYWMQSVVLGIFNVVRIALYPSKHYHGKQGKTFQAVFFLLHYMGFHLAYLVVMVVSFPGTSMYRGWPTTLLGFVVAGLFELRHNLQQDREHPRFSIDGLFFLPYIRIAPMHLFVAGPGLLGISYVSAFLLLKVSADVIFYLVVSRAGRATVH